MIKRAINIFCAAGAAACLCAPPAFSAGPRDTSVWKGAVTVQLDNGLHVIIKEDHAHPVVSVQVWVRAGSVNENNATAGLSHFLEHLIFKGTEKYPGQEISRIVETQGGVINAATSKEFTHFYIDIQNSGWNDAVRLLADAMANAVFPPEEIEKERPVVIEEINRHYDNPGSVLYDLFSESVFRATPYRSSIIGSSDVIKNVSRAEIMDYYHRYYVPSNMVVSIAGDLAAQDAAALVTETFGRQKGAPPPPQPDLSEPKHPAAALENKKPVEHDYWMGGFVGPDILSEEQFAADVASTVLGGGRSSRLYRRLREEKQLVYSIGSSFWTQRGSGVVAVSAVFAPGKARQVSDEVNAEIRRLQKEGPSDAEIKRAREMIKSQWYFGLETAHDQASLLGYWQMQGNPGLPDRYIKSIESVSKEGVVSFLRKYYEPQGLSTALIEPAR